MTTATTEPPTSTPVRGKGERGRLRRSRWRRMNVAGGLGGWIWLAVVILPIYYVVINSLKNQAGFFMSNGLAPSGQPTLDNYRLVLQSGFTRYFLNSAIVAVGSVVPTLGVAFMASYAIVRGKTRFIAATSTTFLLGLALPIQATIIPIYYMISALHMYDTLTALILPSIAFAIPISVLILNNFVRNIPSTLFESMRLDGCSEWQMMWRLAAPIARPGIVTVGIYDALHVWNSFLFPLILTQSPEVRVLPLSLWTFQGEFTVNVPAVLAAVVLSTLPLVVLYIFGRRQLLSGLTAGFGK